MGSLVVNFKRADLGRDLRLADNSTGAGGAGGAGGEGGALGAGGGGPGWIPPPRGPTGEDLLAHELFVWLGLKARAPNMLIRS